MQKHSSVVEIPRLDSNWQRHPSVSANGVTLNTGDQIKVKNQTGLFKMHEYVDTGKHQWVAAHQDGIARSFRLTDVSKPGKVRK